MSFSEHYAKAYDALYRTKDYPAEARFVRAQLQKIIGGTPLRILDMGCGTGLHAAELAGAGHIVVGVDMSAQMLARAEERRKMLSEPARSRLSFQVGDARNVRLGSTFDAVVSLFHVMSYMAGDGDFDAALATVRAHLKPGGAFLFDFWYGPAVLADPPQSRERIVEDAGKRIRRTTTPHWDRVQNVVRIVYDVEETDLATLGATHMSETHVVRYFFEDALKASLVAAGFQLVGLGEWLTELAPSPSTFGVYILARAV